MNPETATAFISRKKREYVATSRPIRMKDIGGEGTHMWVREAATLMPQSGHRGKVFVIERLRQSRVDGKSAYRHKIGDIQYRIGYFVRSTKVGARRGRWLWGQYCPMIPSTDLGPLIEKAKSEGTILGGDAG